MPLVTPSGFLRVSVNFVPASGVVTTGHPPVLTVFNQDGTEFSSLKNMSPGIDTFNNWSTTVTVHATQPRQLNGIKLVTVSVTNTAGNKVTRPIGMYYYAN